MRNGFLGRESRPAGRPEYVGRVAGKNLMKFSKEKCKFLHQGKHNPGGQHRQGSTQKRNSPVERDPGVLVDIKPTLSVQRVLWKRVTMLDCAQKCITYGDKAPPFQCTECLSGHAWNTVLVFSPYTRRLERIQRRAKTMVQGLRSLLSEERLRDMACSGLKKEVLWKILLPRVFGLTEPGVHSPITALCFA